MFYILDFLPGPNKPNSEEFVYLEISSYFQTLLYSIVRFVPRVFQFLLLLEEEFAKKDSIRPTFGAASLPESPKPLGSIGNVTGRSTAKLANHCLYFLHAGRDRCLHLSVGKF